MRGIRCEPLQNARIRAHTLGGNESITSVDDDKINMKTEKTKLVTDIKWDTDGEIVDLPKSIEVPSYLQDDEIADYLSDKYGWCIFSLYVQ